MLVQAASLKKTIKMKYIIAISMILALSFNVHGQDGQWQRQYDFGVYNNHDLRNSSVNAIGAFRLINDGFDTLVTSKMKPKAGAITKSVFTFATTYLSMLWSHEMGHYIRAKQIGGNFNIHNFGLPVPYTTADLPSDVSLTNEAIFVTAGFEVNYLNVRRIQAEFVKQNGLWNEDLGFAFANRLMYPIYTTLITPVDPEEPNVWIETAGDPVHYILPVFKEYSNNNVFLPDSTVNPDLTKFYNQATIFAQFFNFLDPQFYREIGAAFGNSSKTRRPIFLIGDHSNGWTYGTLFNASPLGYELYMQNYIHLKNRQYGLYFKYGRPFKNLGVGLTINDVFKYKNLKADMLVEGWSQDLFGSGGSVELLGTWNVNNSLGLNFNLGYKTDGYVLGKQLDDGLNVGFGMSFRAQKKE